MDKMVCRERFVFLLIEWLTVVSIGLREIPVKSLMQTSRECSLFMALSRATTSVSCSTSVMSASLREGRLAVPGYLEISASLRAIHIPFRQGDLYVSCTTSVGEREALAGDV